jgi:hypothetical protein
MRFMNKLSALSCQLSVTGFWLLAASYWLRVLSGFSLRALRLKAFLTNLKPQSALRTAAKDAKKLERKRTAGLSCLLLLQTALHYLRQRCDQLRRFVQRVSAPQAQVVLPREFLKADINIVKHFDVIA